MNPYKNRQVSFNEKTWCYRNLNRGGYSLVQGDLVVAHADDVTLVNASFVVRESGRQRVLAEGVKNVHAFVVGRVPEMVICPPNLVWHKARYNPRRSSNFEAFVDDEWVAIGSAKCVILGAGGMKVYYPQAI